LHADLYSFKTDSLVGFEGGYTSFDVEKTSNAPSEIKKYNDGEAGIKIGAQTQNYRIFLSIRNYFLGGDYDYFVTYGGEFQYLFNFSKYANFFIGANAGIIDGRFSISGESESRTISDPYYGGDAGFNFHLGKTFDFEVGARVMVTDAKNTKNNITYTFDNLVTGYASIIIKYTMD
jgi:hypothetical protein